jgi:hypothetical protein
MSGEKSTLGTIDREAGGEQQGRGALVLLS